MTGGSERQEDVASKKAYVVEASPNPRGEGDTDVKRPPNMGVKVIPGDGKQSPNMEFGLED